MNIFQFLKKLFTPNTYRVHVIYIVPFDKSNVAEGAITRAIQRLQSWYRQQMSGQTFALDNPVVRVFHSTHSTEWFPNNPDLAHPNNSSGWYWKNVIDDTISFVGPNLHSQYDDWVIYVDANPDRGQYSGGTPHVCVLGAHDLQSLMGISPDWTQCRGIGGSGHEIGHSFGLAHPPPPPNPDWSRAIMGVGYSTFPNCILTEADKTALNSSLFFSPRPAASPPGLCPEIPRPGPSPRPRPVPRPRP